MFDPRDDARDREGDDGRSRVYEDHRDDREPRDGLMRDLDLPRARSASWSSARDITERCGSSEASGSDSQARFFRAHATGPEGDGGFSPSCICAGYRRAISRRPCQCCWARRRRACRRRRSRA